MAQPDRQIQLLDTPPRFKLGKNANARNAYGQAAQEIVCAALGLQPIRINGKCEICFDAKKDNTYFEIKSCHRSSKVVIYDWRMKKEAAVTDPVDYAILLHNARGIKDGSLILSTFAERGLDIIQLPASTVHEIAACHPLHTMKTQAVADKKCGYQRHGYKDGYRNVPVKELVGATQLFRVLEFELHGVEFEITHLSRQRWSRKCLT